MTNSREEEYLQRLQMVVDAFGANRAHWPAADRPALEALLSENTAARDILHDAQMLDDLLDQAPPPPPSPELMADILFIPPKANWQQILVEFWPFGPLWKPASGLAMVLAASIVTASLLPLPQAEADVMEEIEFDIEMELLD